MRLLTKTTLYFLLAAIPALIAGGWYLAGAFERELRDEIDEELMNDRLSRLKKSERLPTGDPFLNTATPEFSLQPAPGEKPGPPLLADTSIFNESENEQSPYRMLVQVVPLHGANYRLYISKSVVERNDYVKTITMLVIGVFAALLIFVLLFNLTISKRIWRPFYRSLDKLKDPELGKMEQLHFPETNVHEFNILNRSLNSMAARIFKDYSIMKEFTEDAAHEMQTPLAIAGSKLEILLQDEKITESQSALVAESLEAMQRLSRLSSALLLLAKIDNGKFEDPASVSFSEVAQRHAVQFEDMLTQKEITISFAGTEDFFADLPRSLAGALIGNLLGNAIKYNTKGGKIIVESTANTLSISNTSDLPGIQPENLFRRFKKIEQQSGSNGLGLAIANKIAEKYGLHIIYSHSRLTHKFLISK